MGRPKLKASEKKVPVHITLDPKLLARLDAKIGAGKPFGSRVHAIESALSRLLDEHE